MTIRTRFSMPLLILVLLGFLAFGATASAAPPVARDGKIYACYKAKGKGKGTLRLVRNGKVRCPRKWKKVSWYAKGAGFSAPIGISGPSGPTGPKGETGAPGTTDPAVVMQLESKVSELLTKVASLEAILAGVTNAELLNAVALVPTVGALCEQAEDLTDQTTDLGDTLGSLNTLLDTLLLGFSPIEVPTALPDFSCPN